MILSVSKKFVFIKTRKCGGTSVQSILKPFCSNDDIVSLGFDNQINLSHPSPLSEFATIEQVKAYTNIEGFWSFGFSRNPYAIPLSRYLFEIKRGKLNWEYPYSTNTLKKYFNKWCVSTYFEYGEGSYKKDRWSKLLLDDKSKETKVDTIFRLENFEESINYISKRLKLPHLKLEKVNVSNTENYNFLEWNSKTTNKLIERYFELELSQWLSDE